MRQWAFLGGGSGSGGGNNQTITIQTDFGTFPVLNTASSILTLTNSDSPHTVLTIGTSGTDTVNISVPGAVVHPLDPSNFFVFDRIPSGLTGAASSNVLYGSGFSALTTGSGNYSFGTGNLNSISTQGQLGAFGSDIFATITGGSASLGVGQTIGNASLIPNNSTFIGNTIATSATNTVTDSIFVGSQIAIGANTFTNTYAFGSNIFNSNVGTGTIDKLFAFGSGIFSNLDNGTNTFALGSLIGQQLFDVNTSTYIGYNLHTGVAFSTSDNIMIGQFIASGVDFNGSSNIMVGSQIASINSSNFNSSTVIGTGAGANLVSGFGAIIIGPGAGFNAQTPDFSTYLGYGAGFGIVTGQDNVSIGSLSMVNASGSANRNLVMGTNAFGAPAGDTNVVIGADAAKNVSVSLNYSTIIGADSITGSSLLNIISLGYNNGNAMDINANCVLVGRGVETSSNSSTNEWSVGSSSYPITRYWWGNGGLANASPSSITMSPTDAVGTNIAGANYIHAASNGTGTGGSGYHDWTVAAPGSTGTTANTLVSSLRLLNTGQITSQKLGAGFSVKEGSNAKMGTAVLVGGTVVVSTTAVTATSRIFLTTQTPGGTIGAIYISARTAGTSFTITSLSVIDTSTVAWIIFEPT